MSLNGGENGGARGATIGDLPDALLSRVLAGVGRQHGSSLTRVCKRWRASFYASPDLWATFRVLARVLDEEPTSTCLSFLSAHQWRLLAAAPVVIEFDFDAAYLPRAIGNRYLEGWALHRFLVLLRPAVLTRLSLHNVVEELPAVAEEALCRLSRLTDLQLIISRPLPRLTATLSKLTTLRALWCACDGQAAPVDGLLEAVLRLTGLTSLAITTSSLLPPQATHQLTRLSELRYLRLWEETRRAARWQQEGEEVQEQEEEVGSLQPPLAEFGGQLRSYNFSRAVGSFQEWHPPGNKLMLSGVHGMPRLRSLLSDMVPLGEPAPTCLELHTCRLCASHLLADCPYLAGLRRLSVYKCTADSGMLSALEAVLQQTPGLLELEISGQEDHNLASVPEGVQRLTGLTKLSLTHHAITDLPCWPGLAGLCELDLGANQLRRLPPALATATSLTRLVLSRNAGLELTAADIDANLACLPGLLELELCELEWVDPIVLEHMHARLPGLQVLLEEDEEEWWEEGTEEEGGEEDVDDEAVEDGEEDEDEEDEYEEDWVSEDEEEDWEGEGEGELDGFAAAAAA